MKTPSYKINPNFRLSTPHMSVAWHLADAYTIDCEAAIDMPGRHVFRYKKSPQVLVQVYGENDEARVDLIYHAATDFEARGIQKWLRELFRDIIFNVAAAVLPARVRHWERQKGLYGAGVEIKRLKNSVLGCCSYNNIITLQPFLVLFKEEWTDEIILHEMAHYRYKHHKSSFWKFLSSLLGCDARQAKAKKDIEMSPYYGYCLYLTKN